jgi:hypothetical protein
MSDPREYTANRCVEQKIDELGTTIEKCKQSDLLGYVGPLMYGCDDIVRDVVESRSPKRETLLVMLETLGGYIEPVRRIVDVLRHNYTRVEFIIPSHAMSAGTILVMSGDSIHMDYYSTLGPIDPQSQTSDGRPIPALGYLVQYNRLLTKANRGQASSAEIAILLNFDQAELYSYEQDRALSVQLLREWLVKYKFKDWTETETKRIPVTGRMRTTRAGQIAKKLNETDRWHAHGTGITMEVLQRDLNLRVDDFTEDKCDPHFADHVRSYHRLLTDYTRKIDQQLTVHRPGEFRFGGPAK